MNIVDGFKWILRYVVEDASDCPACPHSRVDRDAGEMNCRLPDKRYGHPSMCPAYHAYYQTIGTQENDDTAEA